MSISDIFTTGVSVLGVIKNAGEEGLIWNLGMTTQEVPAGEVSPTGMFGWTAGKTEMLSSVQLVL